MALDDRDGLGVAPGRDADVEGSRVDTRVDGVQARLRSPDRVLALSDGVFAIIVTILVLELKVPPSLSSESLRGLFEELRPTLIAWVISFLIAGMYWVAHRDLFARVRFVNRDLVWLNLLFLMPASIIPFAASVLGEYPDEPVAIYLYGVVMITASVMRLVLYSYVIRRPSLLWTAEGTRYGLGYFLVSAPIAVYALAMVVAEAAPSVSVVLYFAVPILYFLLVTILREGRNTRATADDFS